MSDSTDAIDSAAKAARGWWERLAGGLKRTSSAIGGAITDLVTKRRLDAAMVEEIEDVLIRLRIIDGMHEEEHHGFQPSQTPEIFERAGFALETNRRFQLGLNNLFVFTKPKA